MGSGRWLEWTVDRDLNVCLLVNAAAVILDYNSWRVCQLAEVKEGPFPSIIKGLTCL